jgi:AraC-like DNA-binding protein
MNLLRRFRLSKAHFTWSYAFESPSPIVDCQSFGIEIGVVLAGARTFTTPHRGVTRYERGLISIFNLGDQYATRYEPNEDDRGREVGFVVRLDRLDTEHVLSFPDDGDARTDSRLIDVAVELAEGIDRGDGPPKDTDDEVKSFIDRHAELFAIDPLERARLDLVRHFNKALYMRHFAEIAGVHEETFARKFAARYGVTPTRYRMLVRLKEAALLLAMRHDLSVRDVAKTVGFEDPAYFHRAFAAHFGSTPLTLGRSFSHTVVDEARGAA